MERISHDSKNASGISSSFSKTSRPLRGPSPASSSRARPPLSLPLHSPPPPPKVSIFLDPSMPRSPMEPEGFPFVEEEMVVDPNLGYPRAFEKLCGDSSHRFGPYGRGPPFEFYPYTLHTQELIKAKDSNQLFPIIDPEAKPSEDPNNFFNLLWKQLAHIGNAGFDPELFRVDTYGNVLYFYADHASPLSWEIDHWFPCSRGGRTIPSNLRILQWQVRKRKHNRLEFLVPWWDLQLGVSVNQFLSIFASKNSDFRRRALYFLFSDGKGEGESDVTQALKSHKFSPDFIERKRQVGLAPAAMFSFQIGSEPSILKPLSSKTKCPLICCENGAQIQRSTPRSNTKENDNPNVDSNNPYKSIALARDSLRKREEKKKLQKESTMLDKKMEELKQKNDDERLSIQELEMTLIKKRRRVEKVRKLAEAQSSYKELLERMIRDAMHRDVVYKEQLRLNQAARSALMARLEVQRAMCDDSEKDLLKKDMQKDAIEKQIKSLPATAKKRSRMDDVPLEDQEDEPSCSFPVNSVATRPTRKELRQFLEEEQRAYASQLSMMVDAQEENSEEEEEVNKRLVFEEGSCSKTKAKERFSTSPIRVDKEDKFKYEAGKNNVEKWLQVLLNNAREHDDDDDGSPSPDQSPPRRRSNFSKQTTDEVHNLKMRNPKEEIKYIRLKAPSEKEGKIMGSKITGENRSNATSGKWGSDRTSEEASSSKHLGMVRSASAGNLRSHPLSPSPRPVFNTKLLKARNGATKKL